MQQNALLAGVILDQPNTLRRLFEEFGEAARELRDDPRGYLASIKTDARGNNQRKARLRMGLAFAILFYAITFGATLIFWTVNHRYSSHAADEEFVRVVKIPTFVPRVLNGSESGADRESRGGGGGGRGEELPPSDGEIPIFALTPPVVAPVPEPQIDQPLLAVDETVLADPTLQKRRDELAPTGLPDSVPGPPSAGPGSERGIGGGRGGGVGEGDGPGVGPGDGGNVGRGHFQIGGRGLGPPQLAVDSRPMLLNNPRPLYTEDARKHKIQGLVRVKLLVGTDGAVKDIVIVSGLSDGLTEQAIRAAYQMRFTPAMKGGRAVSYWLGNVVIEFNLR